MPPRTDRRRLALVLLVGLVARVALLATSRTPPSDPDLYLPLARSLVEGRGFALVAGVPLAHRPPLYPLLLTPIVALTTGRATTIAIDGLHVALGLVAIALTDATARRWGYGPGRAAIAAAIVALDPVVLLQSSTVMTETLAATLVAASLAATTIPGLPGAALAGLAFGLSGLCRPSLLPGAALAWLALLTFGPGRPRMRAGLAGVFAVTLMLTMLPWAARNLLRFGEPIVTTTHGGYTLYLANNPAYYADVVDGPPGAVWSGPNQAAWFDQVGRETRGMAHPEADRYLRDKALRLARERPATFLRASLARLGRFWGVAPSGAVYPWPLRLASAAWTIPLWIGLAIGLTRPGLRRWPAVVAPLLVLALSALHAAYWTDLRMRVPVVPAIALIAAGAGLGWPQARMKRPDGGVEKNRR